VRIDKIRLAGLAATLIHYLKGEALAQIPIWRMISAPLAQIGGRAELWANALYGRAKVIDGESMVGGGSLPGGTLATRLVAVGEPTRRKGASVARALNYELRRRELPVLGRMNQEQLLLDPRSVLPEEDGAVLAALREAAAHLKSVKEA
jgi:L-seryl-tRNA(Ser) seleniumtransferase